MPNDNDNGMTSDDYMVTSDRFSLIAPDGRVFASKRMAEHLKVVFDNHIKNIPKDERVYPWTVVSRETVLKLVITENTTLDDWRHFFYECQMMLD